jgi:hypothetical protein
MGVLALLGCSGDAVIVLVAGTVRQSDEQAAKQHGLTNREAVGRSQRWATSEPEPLKKAGQDRYGTSQRDGASWMPVG